MHHRSRAYSHIPAWSRCAKWMLYPSAAEPWRRYDRQTDQALRRIDHRRTRAKSPQTNGICERFHRTMQDEFYSIAFRKRLYTTLEQLQSDVDAWIAEYNESRPHSGKYCFGKAPLETFRSAKPLADERQLSRLMPTHSMEGFHWTQGRSPNVKVCQSKSKLIHFRRTKRIRSSISEHSFHGIRFSRPL